jgi:hypothetical protein
MFHHAFPFFGGRVTAFMPPQGLLVVAAYLPAAWQVRFVDENAAPATEDDLLWADVVLTSGMQAQRGQIEDLAARAHARGIPVVLGGPSVSAAPEQYPDVDYLHVGELGDGTDRLIACLDRDVSRPLRQVRFMTAERLPLTDFPTPAYHLIGLRRYFIASVQYSSGCLCRKAPEQVLFELDVIVASGALSVYFVDDNFSANQAAAIALLEALVAWQRRHRYPLRFACGATLNLATSDRMLSLMHEARFNTVFCGVETREPQAVDAVARLNAHGLEVVSGITLGPGSDAPATADNALAFIEASRTPVVFGMGHEPTVDAWLRRVSGAYQPEAIYARFAHNVAETFTRRKLAPAGPRRRSWRNVLMALAMLARIFWRLGVRGDYRRTFWKMARPLLRAGRIESLIHVAIVSHHMIAFTRECVRDRAEPALSAAPPLALRAANRSSRAARVAEADRHEHREQDRARGADGGAELHALDEGSLGDGGQLGGEIGG